MRGRRVYLVQSTVFPANDHFMELLFWVDAFKRASAESVTVVMPYFSYAKGDKKDEPRVSIRARVCADAIEVAGADRVVALDLHAPQIQGFFRIPVDALYALPVLCEAIVRKQLPDLVVVSPDTGFAKQARKYASFLGTSIAIADKQRKAHDERAEALEIIGEVQGKTALIVDDFTISAATLADAAEKLVQRGAKAVYAAVSHGVFSEGSMERLDRSPIHRLLVTDSIETQPVALSQKSRLCQWHRSLGRRFVVSITGKASATCSRRRAMRFTGRAVPASVRPRAGIAPECRNGAVPALFDPRKVS